MKNKNILIKSTLLMAVFLFLGGLLLFGQAIEMNRKSRTVKATPESTPVNVPKPLKDPCPKSRHDSGSVRSASSVNDLLIHKSITVFIP